MMNLVTPPPPPPPMPTINFVDLLGSTFLLNGERDQLDVTDHKGPYTSPDTTYNGSSYNLLIEWEPGEHVLETSSAPTTLVERDKLDLSSLIPPKWTCPFKSHTSSTLCFVNLHLESSTKKLISI